MDNTELKPLASAEKVKRILIAQAKPTNEKSPYFDLAKKYDVELVFKPFIKIEGLTAKEFRKQKIDIADFTSIIFTSRHAIDHFFRLCEALKVTVSQDTKYFCIRETVALYLQKFILYRKRKVFFGTGSNTSMLEVITKHKDKEKFLYVCSETHQENDIISGLVSENVDHELAYMYRTISNDIKETLANENFDIICLFTPSGVTSLLENLPSSKQQDTIIGSFGEKTSQAVTEAGLKLAIKAPLPNVPSMISALDLYLGSAK